MKTDDKLRDYFDFKTIEEDLKGKISYAEQRKQDILDTLRCSASDGQPKGTDISDNVSKAVEIAIDEWDAKIEGHKLKLIELYRNEMQIKDVIDRLTDKELSVIKTRLADGGNKWFAVEMKCKMSYKSCFNTYHTAIKKISDALEFNPDKHKYEYTSFTQ